jgi:hypothetical protein
MTDRLRHLFRNVLAISAVAFASASFFAVPARAEECDPETNPYCHEMQRTRPGWTDCIGSTCDSRYYICCYAIE